MMLTPEQLAELRNGNVSDAIKGKVIAALIGHIDTQHARIAELEKDTARYRWLPIKTAPMDGTAILALLEDSDIPQSVRYVNGGWKVCWDNYRIAGIDGTKQWMPLPDAAMQPTWPEDTSDYGSRIAIVGQNGNDGLAYQEEQP